jgi:hypothetical protein
MLAATTGEEMDGFYQGGREAYEKQLAKEYRDRIATLRGGLSRASSTAETDGIQQQITEEQARYREKLAGLNTLLF